MEHHHAFLGHVPDRIPRTLAADARILHAAIGELVGAPGRAAVDDDAAAAQVANRTNGELHRFGENAGLQAEPAFADGSKNLVDVVIGQQADDWPEHLVAHHLYRRLDARDHGRLDLGAMSPAAGRALCAAIGALLDPAVHSLCPAF